MSRQLPWLAVSGFAFLWASSIQAQESPGAIAARKKLKQKISVEFKEVTTKGIFDDIKNEMEKPVAFKIDTGSGMSLNTKLTYKAKDKTVEDVLNEMAEKFEFGWFVKSDPKDRYDGWVIIRKAKEKERGYEAGKEPKKSAAAERPVDDFALFVEIIAADRVPRLGPVWRAGDCLGSCKE